MSNFKVGDKVVCIEENEIYLLGNNLVYGETYLVKGADYSTGILALDGGISAYAKRFKLYEEKEMEQSAEQIRKEILRMDARIEEAKKDIENAKEERNSLVELLRNKGFILYTKGGAQQGCPPLTADNVSIGDKLILTGDSFNNEIHVGAVVIVVENDKSNLPFKVRCVTSGEEDWVSLEVVKRA